MAWSLSDGVTSYTFAIGPDAMTLDSQRTTSFGFMPSATEKAVVMVSTDHPSSGQLTGTLLSKVQYDALVGWWQAAEVVTITNDLAQAYVVVIKEFAPERVFSAQYPYKHKWTLQFDVIEFP